MANDGIEAGDLVRVEATRGWATGSPVTRVVEGVASFDCEGVLRVAGVNVTTDAAGYYPRGVLVLSIVKGGMPSA